MTPLRDREQVRTEYATDAGLVARASAYRWADGPDAHERVLAAIGAARPRRFLEVGCGQGAVLASVRDELGAAVVGLDQSARMVELTRARGIDAVIGDAEALPFEDASFDCAAALWMLYHVHDIDRALAEAARVLTPGGCLVAVTNRVDHMAELYALLGAVRPETTFSDANGEPLLRRYFARVERVDLGGWVTFPSRAEAQAYVDATPTMRAGGGVLPASDGAVRTRYSPIMFIATK